MPNFISQIIAFNQAVLKIDLRNQSMIPANEAQISIESIIEELNELREAYAAGDLIKSLDAIGDGLFFTIGVLYKFGMTDTSIFSLLSIDYKSELGNNVMHQLFEQHADLADYIGFPEKEDLEDFIVGIESFVSNFSQHCSRLDQFNAVSSLATIANGFICLFGEFGINANKSQQIMTAIFNANMTKKLGVNAKRGDGVAADAVKTEEFVPPEELIGSIIGFDK